MKRNHLPVLFCLLISFSVLNGCDALNLDSSGEKDGDLFQASGVIEAEEVSIASELSGRIIDVFVQESDSVSTGDPLFKLDSEMLLTQKAQIQAQYDSAVAQLEGARAAVMAAEAGLEAAESNLISARIQSQHVLAEARLVEEPIRVEDWNKSALLHVDVPSWYFQQEEKITAAEGEISQAYDLYQAEVENYQKLAADLGNEELIEAEERLAETQASFKVAEALNDRQVGYKGREEIDDFITTLYDTAEAELKAAQKAYDQLLPDPDYQEILESRARVSVSLERYNLALDQHYLLLTGEHSLAVQAANALVTQAEAAVIQAQAQIILAKTNRKSAATTVQQAESAQDLISLQIEKLIVTTPISGVVLIRTIEPGEVIQAGFSAFTIGKLDQLTVTVYLAEDRYGQIKLGDIADLSIDSFPEKTFVAEVIQIADQAEYTPRNVQTQEERQNTVYAIKLSVKNTEGMLKPGMPADVVFHP